MKASLNVLQLLALGTKLVAQGALHSLDPRLCRLFEASDMPTITKHATVDTSSLAFSQIELLWHREAGKVEGAMLRQQALDEAEQMKTKVSKCSG